jgi:hypothetical protein
VLVFVKLTILGTQAEVSEVVKSAITCPLEAKDKKMQITEKNNFRVDLVMILLIFY